MTQTEVRIARRLVTYMLSVAEQQIDLQFFQGLGVALAVVYEEMTGRTAVDKKPLELIQWAKNLPEERYPKVAQ